MKLCKGLMVVFLLWTVVVTGQIPSGYYDAAAGKTGEQLQSALHGIIKDHYVVSYTPGVWNAFYTTDKKSNGTVWDMYSDVPGGNPPYVYQLGTDQCGSGGGAVEGDCYSREHSWPKSWFGDSSPMDSDLFHIYPADQYVNGRRSNNPYGEVDDPTWTSENGGKLGDCVYPGYSGTAFEPISEYKGDLARTYFYMSTRYYGEDGSWPGSDMTDGARLKTWAIKMLLEWNSKDPVSLKERNRNEAVYQLQQNRNPFIDHPEYVNLIWGNPAGMDEPDAGSLKISPNPFTVQCSFHVPSGSDTRNTIVSVYSMIGQKVMPEISFSDNRITIEMEGFSEGLYLLILTDPERRINYRAILVKE